MNKYLVDSGFLYALFDQSDRHHPQALAFTENARGTFLFPSVTLVEVTYLFKRGKDRSFGTLVAANFLRQFSAIQPDLIDLVTEDLDRTHEIMNQYARSDYDFVDASVMA